MSALSGSGLMFPVSLQHASDIRRTRSHMAAVRKCWHRVVDVSLRAKDGELGPASRKLSVIWNHWWPSHKEPLWRPNRRGFDKSHVQRVPKPADEAENNGVLVVPPSLKPDFLPKKINPLTRLRSCHLALTWICTEETETEKLGMKRKPKTRRQESRADMTNVDERAHPVCLFCLPNLNKGTPTLFTPSGPAARN